MLSVKPHKKFSECGIQKLSGRQYRTSRCLDNGFMEECIAAGKEHKRQTRKCTPSCKQAFIDARPPKYLYDESSDKSTTPKKNSLHKYHPQKSEDYELVTNGDVEDIKRRSRKVFPEKNETKQDKISRHNEATINSKTQNISERYNHVLHANKSQNIKKSNNSPKDLFNIALPDMREVSSNLNTNGEETLQGKNDSSFFKFI